MEGNHQLRNKANIFDKVDGLTNSQMSTGKLANENYISVFEKDEGNIYDTNNTTVTVTQGANLRGWIDPVTQLWRIP